jgi:hypothetical protein
MVGYRDNRHYTKSIGMEYCSETLENRTHGEHRKGAESASMLDSEKDQGEVHLLSIPITQVHPNKTPETNDPNDSSLEFDWQSAVGIIQDITQGLIYLHKNNTVHQDLQPKNGTRFPDVFEFILHSPLLSACWALETQNVFIQLGMQEEPAPAAPQKFFVKMHESTIKPTCLLWVAFCTK